MWPFSIPLQFFNRSPPQVTVIIPTLNEASSLPKTLTTLRSHAVFPVRVIVVDAFSTDRTINIARRYHAQTLKVSGGRGAQLNAGASKSKSPYLLFLHADTLLPPRWDIAVRNALTPVDVSIGAFKLGIEGEGWGKRVVEWGANIRSRWGGRPYGDQGLFVRRHTFEKDGGFRKVGLMEDYEWVTRLGKKGKIVIAQGNGVTTSARRWQVLGVWRTTFVNQIVILGWHLGVGEDRLRKFYRGVYRTALHRMEKGEHMTNAHR